MGGFERDDVAAAEEAPELHLSGRATGLGHDWGGRHWDDAGFEPCAMVGPDVTVVAVGGDQDTGVVDGGQADRLRGVASSRATRCRAAAISSGVNAPLMRSHSATAASPSRTTSARRAASVIHADTLTPSWSAALTTRAWTSGSTVMASLGDGFPRGMGQVYDQGGIEETERRAASGQTPSMWRRQVRILVLPGRQNAQGRRTPAECARPRVAPMSVHRPQLGDPDHAHSIDANARQR